MYLSYSLPVLYSIMRWCSKSQLLAHGRAIRALCVAWPPSLSLQRRHALIRLLRFCGRLYRAPVRLVPRNTV
jgi:hypothetical protein